MIEILSVSVDNRSELYAKQDCYYDLLLHCSLPGGCLTGLWTTRACGVCLDQESSTLKLVHRNPANLTQRYCVKEVRLDSPLVSVHFPEQHPSPYTVVLILTNGDVQFWTYKTSQLSGGDWSVGSQVSLLQWEHQTTQIKSAVFSAGGSTVFWSDECSLGGTTYRHVCSASFSETDLGTIKLEAVSVLLEGCPPCQLYILEKNLIMWPHPSSPPDVYLCWEADSQTLAVHVLQSLWCERTRRLGPEPTVYRDLVMAGRHVWSQHKKISYKIIPSKCRRCLYVLSPEGNLVTVNSNGSNVSTVRLMYPDDVIQKYWDVLAACETHQIICLSVLDRLVLYRVADGTLMSSIKVPGGSHILNVMACLSDVFSLHLITTESKLFLIKLTKTAQTAKDAHYSVNSELSHLMAALCEVNPGSEETFHTQSIEDVVESEPSASCFKSIFGDTADQYVKLEKWKKEIFGKG